MSGKTYFRAAAVVAAITVAASSVSAQSVPMNCIDVVAQDPSKILRSGLWKEWIYWIAPGPDASAAIARVVAEVNVSRATAGLPLLMANASYPLILSVFDEANPRGLNGSSAIEPVQNNEEVFFATFVDDTAGGSEVLFLTDNIRSNVTLTNVKGVPGITGVVNRDISSHFASAGERVDVEWHIVSTKNDRVSFEANYPSSSFYFRSVTPAARVTYANCDLQYSTDVVFRSRPATNYALFDRNQGNYIDLTAKGVHVTLEVHHSDAAITAMFNDPQNVPIVLIETDRDVRIQAR